MSNLRKNQLKSLIYYVLVAVITYFFIMGKYIYYVMPNSVAIFLLLFISLGMTLTYSEKAHERAASVGLPLLFNIAFFLLGAIGCNGLATPEAGLESMYWIPLHILNPNLTFMPYFIEKANVVFKYFLIIIAPSFLLYIGMILGNKIKLRLYKNVNNLDLNFFRKRNKKY